jgi:hypothetical protein
MLAVLAIAHHHAAPAAAAGFRAAAEEVALLLRDVDAVRFNACLAALADIAPTEPFAAACRARLGAVREPAGESDKDLVFASVE